MCVAAAIAGSAVIGAGASAYSANKQSKSAKKAAKLAAKQNAQIRDDNAPWRDAAQPALTRISELMGTGGNKQAPDYGFLNHQFNADDLKTHLAPNYDFMLKQGLGAATNAGAAGGFSGNTLKGVNDYAQDYAGNAYQQAYNNFTGNQTNIYNRLSNLAGLGQTANQITANAGTNLTGQQIGAYLGGANAQAAGMVGGANALNNGVSNYIGWNYLNKTPGTFTSTPGVGRLGAGGSPDGYWADGGPVRHYAWGGPAQIRSMNSWSPRHPGLYPMETNAEPMPNMISPRRTVMPTPRMDTQPGAYPTQLGLGTSLGSIMNYGPGQALQPPKQKIPSRPWMASPPVGFEGGGEVDGPGGPRDDAIPAMLSNGEHVFDTASVNALGDGDNDVGQMRLNRIRDMLHRRPYARH